VALAPQPFLIFCVILCLSIQHPHTLNMVQYLADRDVGKVIWFQDMMAHMPKSYYFQRLTVTKNMQGSYRCLFASITPVTRYQPQFKQISFSRVYS